MCDQDHESFQIMESTQAISWDAEEEEEKEEQQQEESSERSSESLQCKLEPIGQLHIFSGTHGPERDFPLYLGKNLIGRNPDCSVVLPFPSISRCHAVIKISAWDKAPLLQDCGSLNGTHIVRPPKALSRGVNHRLRDQEFILFANLPCQYRQLDVPLHLISGPFIIQGIPRLQGRSHSSRVLLVEDSEEEEGFPSRRHSMNGSTTTSSPLGTVVPESDEEVPSPGVSGPSLAFNMSSDTDEEVGQQSATEARTAAGIRPVHIHRAKQRFKDTKDKRKRGNGVVVGSILEQSTHLGEDSDTNRDEEHQPSGFVDSDTDVDEHIPATPVVVPVGKRQVLPGVRMRGPGASSGAHLQGIPAGNNMGMKEDMALQASALERSHTTVVINSDTDDEEEVSVALTLAHLKESSAGAALWSRDPDVEEDRAQPQVLVQQSQSASGRNSDTDMEEEGLPGQKRETVPHHSMDRDGALIKTHSEESQHPLRPNSVNEGVDGSQLEGNQASLVMVNNHMEMEGEAPPQPAVTLVEKYQVPVEGTHQTDVEAKKVPLEEARPPEEDWETDVEEGPSSGVTDVRNSQLPTVGDAGTEWTAAVPERESTLEVGTKGRSTTAPVEQIMVYTGTRGKPTQPQREGAQTPIEREREAHVGRTKNSKDYSDDSEDLCLLATQCFVKTESESPEAVQSMEDEPTQIFPCLLPQDLGLSHCSLQIQGPGALDVPWEVLDTQPFNLRDADAESQLIAINPEAHGSCSTLPRPPQQPHLVHTSRVHREPLGIQGRELQTVEKAMGIPKETAERVTPGRGLLEREVGERPPDSEQEGVSGEEELTRGIEDKSQNQVLLGRDSQRQDSDKVKSSNPERDRENLKGEMAVTKNEQEKEREEETSGRERERKPDELEGTLDRKATVGKSQDQKGQIASPTLQPGVGAEDLEGLTSTLVASGSQGNEGKGAPVTSRRKQRGQLSCKVPSAEKASRDGPEFPAPCQLPIVPEASAPPQTPLTSQSQKQSVPQPLTSPFSPSEQRLHKPPHRKPSVRFQRASRMTSSPLSSAASPTEQPATPRPTSQATRSSRATRSSTRTPESVIPTSSELQPPASTNQPAIPKPPSQSVTRGRTNRSSVKTPEPVVPTGPEIQPPTSIDRPVTPSLTSRVTRGRLSKSFVKTPEPLVSSGPKLQPPTSAHQPVIPKPTSRVTRGRRNRSSAKSLEPVVPTGPELQSPTYTDQPITPNLTSQGTQSRTSKSSIKTEPVPTTPEFQPPTSIDQPVIPEVTGQSRTLKSSSLSIAPLSTTPEQPPVTTATSAALESMTQVSHGRGRRATGKQGSRTVPIGHKPYSAVSEHESQSSTNQSSAAKSLTTTPEPAISQLPETPTQSQAPLIQNEAAGNSGLTPERKPEVLEIRKRLSTTTDSLPPQKHPRKEIFQNTVFPKEEDTAEVSVKEEPQDQAIPVPGKRKRNCAEDEPQGISSRTLRRTKPNQEAAPPKVLFTGVVDSRGERAVLSLGGSLASSVNEASYLITDRIRRTVKFLCALGKGIPILSLNWLYQSRKAGYFLPPDEYLLADAEQERNFNFSLRDSLNRARNQRLLEGYEIHVTPRVQPPPAQMGEIISYCGGTALPSMPRSYKPHRVVITCAQDLPRCTLPSRVGIPLVSSEFLLTGVLKQEATPEAFVLSSLETSPT